MRKAVLAIVGILVLSMAGALAYAPYLPQLLLEGPPALIWNGKGTFVSVSGAQAPRDIGGGKAAQTHALTADLQKLFTDTKGMALLVARAGHLEIEHYAQGVTPDTRFNSYSMAKSLIGALIYRAIADKKIASLDTSLGTILPDDKGLADVTLRSLITMRAGIHFETEGKFGAASPGMDADTSPNPFGPLARLHFAGLDTLERGLTVQAQETPKFLYQNVNTALLGAVLEVVYGRSLESLMAEQIWQPAMAQPALWRKPTIDKPVSAYCCIYASPRDWIRIGLYLNANGTPDAPFLPQPLWREFMGLDIDPALRAADHYGNHVYQNVLDRPGQALQGPFTYLMGQGGQVLYLMPERDLVVYRSGEGIQLLHSTLYGAWNSLDHAAVN